MAADALAPCVCRQVLNIHVLAMQYRHAGLFLLTKKACIYLCHLIVEKMQVPLSL